MRTALPPLPEPKDCTGVRVAVTCTRRWGAAHKQAAAARVPRDRLHLLGLTPRGGGDPSVLDANYPPN